MKNFLTAILRSYSDIFFISNAFIGAILCACTFLHVSSGVLGLVALFSAALFSNFISENKYYLTSGFYLYNPLLVGLSIGYLYHVTPLTLCLSIFSGILTYILTTVMAHILHVNSFNVLSLPFVIVSSVLYLASGNFSNLYVTGLAQHTSVTAVSTIPLLDHFFRSLGAIIFQPYPLTGLIFFVLILIHSRLLALLAFIGFLWGSMFNGLFTGLMSSSFSNINNFNYSLIMMSLGGVFLVPSIQSVILGLIAVTLSTLITGAVKTLWAYYSIPLFTLPFNLIIPLFLYFLHISKYHLVPKFIQSSPEETADLFRVNEARFSNGHIHIALPFQGIWKVWQAFDDEWTHQGSWKYAYDFIVVDKDEKPYTATGTFLEEYYTFNQPVYSPIQGRVITVVNHIADNPIGQVDHVNNWGNCIVIYDIRGIYVELSHFKQNSISVASGDWIQEGDYIGLCGNSGYSPQPHIHIQVQLAETIGSATIPFQFSSYKENSYFKSHGLPEKNALVMPIKKDFFYDKLFTFILDDVYTFDVLKHGSVQHTVSFTVKMNWDGTFYFEAPQGKLFFGKKYDTFYCYYLNGKSPELELIYTCLASIPLGYVTHAPWENTLPIKVAQINPIAKSILHTILPFIPFIQRPKTILRFISYYKIEGHCDCYGKKVPIEIELDPVLTLKTIRYGHITLRRRT